MKKDSIQFSFSKVVNYRYTVYVHRVHPFRILYMIPNKGIVKSTNFSLKTIFLYEVNCLHFYNCNGLIKKYLTIT